jgi:PQQ-dependent dehydrogenase (methanol/ethanol family)
MFTNCSLASRFVALLLTVLIAGVARLAQGAPTSEWSVLGNGDGQQYFSPLRQINDKNVKDLGISWYANIPSQDGLVGNALVADGVVYQSGALSRVFANDARTGKLLWRFDPLLKFTDSSLAALWSARYNRGLALSGANVIVATGDCRLIAINRATGQKAWESVSCDRTQLFGITGAPRVGGGKVFIGNNCIDSGVGRGYVDAFDARTGAPVWRFYTVPGPPPPKGYENKAMEMASKTWGGGEWWKKSSGCGSAWDAITYDPKTNLVYFGVDGPSPFNPAQRAPDAGDELFTNSIVAVNADTGEYVWHYKTTPHDGWNFDATMHIMVADLPIGGKPRHVVMTAPKNGFFYVLDAASGKFISASNFVPVNWASHIDPKTGRPVTLPDARYWEHPDGKAIASPGPNGAHNWMPMAFNPATHLVYIPAMILPTLIAYDPKAAVGGVTMDDFYGLRGDPKFPIYGDLVAWDPLTQKAAWHARRSLPINGGIMSTGGNLVFQGTADGYFEAYSADKGEKLWSRYIGESIMGAPTTVELDGQQVIFVPVGNSASVVLATYFAKLSSTRHTRGPSRLLAFKLGGNVTLPPTPVITVAKPPRPKQPIALAKKGSMLFEEKFCVDCHGLGAESASGSIPDLRNASAQTHDMFEAIVLGGARLEKGMPRFSDISADEIQAIHAYLINQAWTDYEEQEAKKQQH